MSEFALYALPLTVADVDRRVLLELREGAARARTGRDVGLHLDLSEREVRASIDRLLKHYDVLICASVEPPRGYFIAATEGERMAYHRQLVGRLREVADRARRVRRLPLYGRPQPADLLSLMSEPEPILLESA